MLPYKDFLMVCGRCNSRLERKMGKTSKVYLDEASFKEIKTEIKKELIKNPKVKLKTALLRTGCTGYCPKNGVSCLVLDNGVLTEQKVLETFDWSKQDWAEYVKRECLINE